MTMNEDHTPIVNSVLAVQINDIFRSTAAIHWKIQGLSHVVCDHASGLL